MMTLTHWFLHLTTTFTFASLAGAGNSCPRVKPFAYHGGDYCCETNKEKLCGNLGKKCDGSFIGNSSTCCQGDEFIPCTNKPCMNHGTCTTQKCHDVSERISKFINLNADPCEDFEQFACGKFLNEYQLPPDQFVWLASLSPITNMIYNRGKELMEKVPAKESPFMTDKFSRKVYSSCMDTLQIQNDGVSRAKEIFEKLGGWPAVKGASWDESGYHWWNADPQHVSLGLVTGYVLYIRTFRSFDNAKLMSLNLDQPKLGLKRDLLLKGFNDKIVQHYYNFMVKSAKLMGAKSDTAYKEMKDALLFEIDLASISVPDSERIDRSKLNNKRTIRELEGQPGYPPSLLDFINNIYTSAGVADVKFDLDDSVTVISPHYAGNLSGVVDRTSPRAIANYQAWRVYRSLIPLLSDDAKEIEEEFKRKYLGIEKPPPRWKTCLQRAGFNAYIDQDINDGMVVAAASLYAREYFTPEGKEKVREMVKYVRRALENSLKRVDWMDSKTKFRALEKLKAMGGNLAYHDDLLKPDVLNNFFKDLKITDNYFNNVLALQQFWRAYYLRALRKPIGKNHFAANPWVAMGNAFYLPWENAIQLPAGILHEDIYDPFGPRYKNYGGMAFIIGHEITHGFDNLGRQYDLEGNLKNWWEDSTDQNFNEKAKCMIYQYGNYTSKQAGMKLNGLSTLGENIADNGGLNAAFSAYEKDIEVNGEEPILPGYSFTHRQLFWIFYAQFWCTKWRKQGLIDQIKFQPHSPPGFRIRGVLSNNHDFAKDFNCPPGSPMNPVHKCKVW